jgi:thiol-disulfide isomerase/thioredoxin
MIDKKMIKYIGVITACLFTLSAWAQKPINIKGRVEGATPDSILVANLTQNSIALPFQQYTKVNKDGTFAIKVPTHTKFNIVAFMNGKMRKDVVVESATNIELTLVFNNQNPSIVLDSIKYKTTYINEKYVALGGFPAYINKLSNAFDMDRNVHQMKLERIYNEELAMIKNLVGNQTAMLEYYDKQLQLYKYNTTLLYASRILNQQANLNVDSINAITQYSLQAPIVVDDKLIYYPIYQDYVVYRHLYDYMYKNITTANDLRKNVEQTLGSINKLSNKETSSLASAKLLQMIQGSIDEKTWVEITENYLSKAKLDDNKKILENLIKDIKKFEVGQKAIDFEFVTIDGQKKKLSDYKGKVVYLDFWASWCGPCRQQMPFAKEIKKYFEGKDVVFLYVSIDDTDEKWKNGIHSMQVEGVQTRSGGWGGDIPKLYNITSIPAYFLIDKKGNFAERPSRPSDKENLIKQIESLL